jgi:uncharacterized protein YkwD
VYLTEIVVEPLRERARAPAEDVHAAIARARARCGAAPLARDPRLDELARASAAEMARAERLDQARLADRAFELERRWAAADAIVSADPEEAAATRNTADPRGRRVGVGVARGAGRRYGTGVFWVAVVYTD